MHPRREVPAELLRLAAGQGGLLTQAQALRAMGRTPIRRLVAQGDWQVAASGLLVPSPLPVTDEQRLWAGVLLGGEGSGLGGLAALFLADIVQAPDTVDVWLPAGRRRAGRTGWLFREDFWGRLDHVTGTLPRIRLEEALLDVGPTCDVEGWVTLLAEATRLKRVALPEVVRRLDLRTKLGRRAMLRDVAIDLQGIESTLEWVYRRDVERAHGLPTGERQVRTVGRYRCDVRYRGYRLIAELDGMYHRQRVQRDLDRDNDHALRNETTVRYGSVDVRGRPCRVAWQVGGAIHVRGGDLPRACPRCPDAETIRAWLEPEPN